MSAADRASKKSITHNENNNGSVNIDALFQDVHYELFEKLTKLLGRTVAEAMFLSVWNKLKKKNPLLERCSMEKGKLVFSCENSGASESELLEVYLSYFCELVELLVELTGNVFTKSLSSEVDHFVKATQYISKREEESDE